MNIKHEINSIITNNLTTMQKIEKLNKKNKDGKTLFFQAVEIRYIDGVIKILGELNSQQQLELLNQEGDQDGNTAIFKAFRDFNEKMIRAIVDNTDNDILLKVLEKESKFRNNAINELAMYGNKEIVLYILNKLNKEQRSKVLGNPHFLHVVFKNNVVIKVVKAILDNINDEINLAEILGKENEDGNTALIDAVIYRKEIVQYLLNKIKNEQLLFDVLSKTNKYGNTALIEAVKMENIEITREILNKIKNEKLLFDVLSKTNKYGNTALIEAVKMENIEITREILNKIDSDLLIRIIFMKNKKDKDALSLAKISYDEVLLSLFINKLNDKDKLDIKKMITTNKPIYPTLCHIFNSKSEQGKVQDQEQDQEQEQDHVQKRVRYNP